MKSVDTATVPAMVSVAPRLALAPAGRAEVKAGEPLAIAVDFAGVEGVDLRLEPAGVFRMDLASLQKPGTVRLRGLADGKASLVATARGADVSQVVHLACEGPVVRISSFAYVPPVE